VCAGMLVCMLVSAEEEGKALTKRHQSCISVHFGLFTDVWRVDL
jgi:hypothetical protein